MLSLHLSDEEAHVLRILVESRLSSLAVEISHTDTRDFREGLQHQWSLLESTLTKLSPTVPVTAAASAGP